MGKVFIIIAFIGIIEAIVLIFGAIWGFVLWTRGVFPVLLRIGNGLAKRKIAIFAKGDNVSSLKSLLIDSGLFKEKNIFEITVAKDIGSAEKASVYLVHWHDWAGDINKILLKKPDRCPMVVYAPYDMRRIPDDKMVDLDSAKHTAVTNFRGRLLNDIVTAMITTNL